MQRRHRLALIQKVMALEQAQVEVPRLGCRPAFQ